MIRAVVKFTREALPDGNVQVRWNLRHWHPKNPPWRGAAVLTSKAGARQLIGWLTTGAWYLHPGEQFDAQLERPVARAVPVVVEGVR